jgi:hypothetical protein
MTNYDANWVAEEEARRAWMDAHSLYRAEDEHSSCGVGLVVSIDGKASRRVVEHGIEALKAVWHRGAMPTARPATGRASMCRFRSGSSTTRSAGRGTSRT